MYETKISEIFFAACFDFRITVHFMQYPKGL